MTVSVFDLFKVGVGPSSSHTVGPMIAARRFLLHLQNHPHSAATSLLEQTHRVTIQLHGSLAHTGKGHATSSAILMGLQGEEPAFIDAPNIPQMVKHIIKNQSIRLLGLKEIPFIRKRDVIFDLHTLLPEHPNGITFSAFDQHKMVIKQRRYFSIGGGFVLSEDEINAKQPLTNVQVNNTANGHSFHKFNSATELLDVCRQQRMTIPELILNNERALDSLSNPRQKVIEIWNVMEECIHLGCNAEGDLPGGLHVKRRAKQLHQKLRTAQHDQRTHTKQLRALDWVNVFAIAVNEQNASGGRVVTAPTNGAAGVIPAVLAYYLKFINPEQSLSADTGIVNFLCTASAIGSLFKQNASISAAEVGCQGEVGVACSMAAAGLTSVLGGSLEQIENAAEIGMEHNLGLTCDPIKGLVQIPCIERNTMGAVQAINAAQLALSGDGCHKVSLDQVIETMRQTGRDMQDKYKETSLGGLAVNFIEC